jgi:hypothetical protein
LTGSNFSNSSDEEEPFPMVPHFYKPDVNNTASVPVTKEAVITAKHALQQHQLKVITGSDDEDFQRITVRRSHLMMDAFRLFSKSKTNLSKRLKVVFLGESSVDEGGPRREFFQLLLNEIFVNSGLFIGWPSNVIPVSNFDAVGANKYFIVGRIISTSLVQGGATPACFCQAIAKYLAYDQIRCDPCIDDITDEYVKNKLMKVILAIFYLNLDV